MPLQIHHLRLSQSERILWLCEELSLPYTLHTHIRNPTTGRAPPSLTAIHPVGTAPVMIDDTPTPPVVLAESGAIVEYIINVYGGGRLAVKPGESNYAEYLSWFHFANASLQVAVSRMMLISRLPAPTSEQQPNPMVQLVTTKLTTILSLLDARLSHTNAYLAGDDLTAADIMSVFSLTTMRGFASKVELGGYGAILAYLGRVAGREAYKRAMEKGDPGLVAMVGGKVEGFKFG